MFECMALFWVLKLNESRGEVIYEQRERVSYQDIQTRENNDENTSAQRECSWPLFSSVRIYPGETLARVFI